MKRTLLAAAIALASFAAIGAANAQLVVTPGFIHPAARAAEPSLYGFRHAVPVTPGTVVAPGCRVVTLTHNPIDGHLMVTKVPGPTTGAILIPGVGWAIPTAKQFYACR